MQLPSPGNIPGNAIAQFGQDLVRFGEIGLRRQNSLDQAQRDVEISKAYTTMNESVVGKFREFQQNWDAPDEAGQPHYLGYGTHFDSYREQLWSDLSKTFSDPQTADLFFPTFNEAMSQQKIKVEELVHTYKRAQVQEDFLDLIDRTVQMPGMSPETKKADLKTELANMIQHGIVTADEAAAVETEKFYQIDFNAVSETAGTMFNSQGWDATRSYLMRAEGLKEEDRKKLLARFGDEDTYQKKRQEEERKVAGGQEYLALIEDVEEGRISSHENLFEHMKVRGRNLSEAQVDKLRNAIKGEAASAKNPELKSDQGFMNDLYLAKIRGEDIDTLEEKAYWGANPDNFEDGVPRITAKDAQEFIQETRKDIPWHSRVTDELAAEIRDLAVGDDAIIPNAETEVWIADMLEFANSQVKPGDPRTPQAPRVDESLIRDWLKARVTERVKNRVKREGLRSFMDSAPLLPLSGTEKVLQEAEQGLYTGVVKEDVIKKYLAVPELSDYVTMGEEIARTAYGRRFDDLPERQKNEVVSNANMVVVLHNLKNAAADELGVTSPILALTNRGEPLVIDSQSGKAYTARTVDKDEKWFYWDDRLEDYVPLERD